VQLRLGSIMDKPQPCQILVRTCHRPNPVGGSTRNLQAALEALRRHGVEVGDDYVKLTKRRR